MLLVKLCILLILSLMMVPETSAVRGALFRSGRAVPFERIPGQQKLAPQCREVELFVPCLFTGGRNCMIDKLCVHETPITTTAIPSTKRMPPPTNDFLRFGRASPAADGTVEQFMRMMGEPEVVYP